MKVALSKYLGRRLTSKTGITLGIAWMGESNLPHPTPANIKDSMKLIFEGNPEQIREEMLQFLQVPTKQIIKKTGTYEDSWNSMTPTSKKLLGFLAEKDDWISQEQLKSITSSNHNIMGAMIANTSRAAGKYSLPTPIQKQLVLPSRTKRIYRLNPTWSEFLLSVVRPQLTPRR
jgi:hypothetical protein|tara:strand:- start:190 stop:711 length:522 start_codon:yes stop_codon:yes gene_type:complete